jgi:hypothetical protein
MTPCELEDVCTQWTAAMNRGDFEVAWRQTDRIELERRALLATGRLVRRDEYLYWNGSAFDRQRVLVRCTRGLGDTIQSVRYVPLLRQRTKSVCVLVQPQLLPLFRDTNDFADVRNGWTDAAPPAHDVEIEVMELPYAFRSTLETIPRAVPYLPLASLTGYADLRQEVRERCFDDVGVAHQHDRFTFVFRTQLRDRIDRPALRFDDRLAPGRTCLRPLRHPDPSLGLAVELLKRFPGPVPAIDLV